MHVESCSSAVNGLGGERAEMPRRILRLCTECGVLLVGCGGLLCRFPAMSERLHIPYRPASGQANQVLHAPISKAK